MKISNNMPGKKIKKITKKSEDKSAIANAVVKEEDEKTLVVEVPEETKFTPIVEQDISGWEDVGDEEISREIAKKIKEKAGKPDRFFEAIGRRKTAEARVRLFTKGEKE